MRRFLALLLIICLLSLPVRAETPRYVALTFDDGPTAYTPALLEGLRERNVRATFFPSGCRMAEAPELVAKIAEDGHELGLHGRNHRRLDQLSRREIAAEIVENRDLLPAGVKARWLRPPCGGCSVAVEQVAKAKNLGVLTWSVDSRDWESGDAEAITRRVVDAVEDGDVVLLHDTSESSVQAALAIADQLQSRGFRLVTVSELARFRGETLRPGKRYQGFPPREKS